MQTRITELLNIDYPIFQGGMAWVADGDLAGAVSKAGGLGIIGGGNAPKEVVKANIDKIKSLTDRPFGVNIMLLSPFADDIVDLVIEEGVKVVTTGAGNPSKHMARFHELQLSLLCQVWPWLSGWKKSVRMQSLQKEWKLVVTSEN
mgnify:CR=1 FL=1